MKLPALVRKAAYGLASTLLLPFTGIAGVAQTVIATIPVQPSTEGFPMTIAVNPLTHLVYIAGDGVEVVDQRTNQPVTTFSVGQNELLAIGINPLTRKLYVADFNTGVYIVDLTSNAIVAQYPIPVMRGMTYNPITNLVYALDNYENIWVIDGTTGALVKEIAAPANIAAGYEITINPATNLLYVLLQTQPDTLYVVNAITNAATMVPLEGGVGGYVEVDPLRNIVYISDTGSAGGQVEVMDGATNKDVAIVGPISGGPSDLSVDPLTRLIYLSNENGNVDVINGTTNTLTSTVIPVGTNPIHSTLDLVHGLLYVGNTALYQPGTPSVSVISLN
jgi:DNA-binding beta-propeller fold protein YncE